MSPSEVLISPDGCPPPDLRLRTRGSRLGERTVIWSKTDLLNQRVSRRRTASDVGGPTVSPRFLPSGDGLSQYTYFPERLATFPGGALSSGCRQMVVSAPALTA